MRSAGATLFVPIEKICAGALTVGGGPPQSANIEAAMQIMRAIFTFSTFDSTHDDPPWAAHLGRDFKNGAVAICALVGDAGSGGA